MMTVVQPTSIKCVTCSFLSSTMLTNAKTWPCRPIPSMFFHYVFIALSFLYISSIMMKSAITWHSCHVSSITYQNGFSFSIIESITCIAGHCVITYPKPLNIIRGKSPRWKNGCWSGSQRGYVNECLGIYVYVDWWLACMRQRNRRENSQEILCPHQLSVTFFLIKSTTPGSAKVLKSPNWSPFFSSNNLTHDTSHDLSRTSLG